MARLIRTEKEVEGRYTEQWVVVEGDDDALDQWPQGPGEVVGRPAPRQDGHQRARGQAIYTGDLKLPGLLHAAVLRSPHARARVSKLDFGRALELPGVLGVVGPDDCHVLQTEPAFHGAPVAAVAADSYEQAREALALVEVEWEELEPLLDPAEAVRRKSFVDEPRSYERGDVDAGFAEADVVVEAEYRTQTVLHNAMETHQSVARWEGDTLEIYISTQFIWGSATPSPGSSSCRPTACAWSATTWAAASARRTGPAIHVHRDRAGREDRPPGALRAHAARGEPRHRQPQRHDPEAAGRRAPRRDAGRVEAEYVNTIGWSGFSGPTYGPIEMLYACENVRTQTYGTKLNLPPNAAFRAPGFVEGTFGLECVLDELAARLELDPLELRRRNHADNDLPTAVRSRPRSCSSATTAPTSTGRGAGGARELGGTVGAAPGSPARSGTAAAARPRTPGCASAPTAARSCSRRCRTSAPARAPRWRRSPPRSSGCRSSASRCELGDSARGPYASISAGSSTTPSMGPAVRAAAADAARQIIEIAAQRHHLEERVLSLKDGKIVSADGGSWPLEEVTGLLEDAQILGKGSRGPNPTGMRVLTFGVQVADVAVDIETGEVRVDRIAAIHDVGRVINPLGAQSQVEGGIIQGVGHTLSEERLRRPGERARADADARHLQAADDRRRAGDGRRAARHPGRAPDEPRLEGPRRAADRADRRGDRERDPRRDRRRRALAAGDPRGDAAGAARRATGEEACA